MYMTTIPAYTCSFCNQLQTVHLNGKVNCRVDFLIYHLLQYKKDDFSGTRRTECYHLEYTRVRLELNRHHKGLQIPTVFMLVHVFVVHVHGYLQRNTHIRQQCCSAIQRLPWNWTISVLFSYAIYKQEMEEESWHVESMSGISPDEYTIALQLTMC